MGRNGLKKGNHSPVTVRCLVGCQGWGLHVSVFKTPKRYGVSCAVRLKGRSTDEVHHLPRHRPSGTKPYRRQRGSSAAYLGAGRTRRGGRSNEETMARQRVVAAGLGVEEINGVAELRWRWSAVQLRLATAQCGRARVRGGRVKGGKQVCCGE
jgi:hypothetical protein